MTTQKKSHSKSEEEKLRANCTFWLLHASQEYFVMQISESEAKTLRRKFTMASYALRGSNRTELMAHFKCANSSVKESLKKVNILVDLYRRMHGQQNT